LKSFAHRSHNLQFVRNLPKRCRFGHFLDGFQNKISVAHNTQTMRRDRIEGNLFPLVWAPFQLHRNRRFDAGERVVAFQGEVLEFEVVDVFDGGIQVHLRQWARVADELEFRLFEMIGVEMQIAEGVDEFTGFQIADLRKL
jgi:hypothetical protein